MSTAYAHQTEIPNPGRIDLAVKLLKFALDPACEIGEAQNASAKFVVVARRENVSFDALASSIGRQLPPPKTSGPLCPDECEIAMPFGKHQGKTLGELAKADPAYLVWMSKTMNDEFLREAAEVVVAWMKRRQK